MCQHALVLFRVVVRRLYGQPVSHLSHCFRYGKLAKEAQTNNDILGLPGA